MIWPPVCAVLLTCARSLDDPRALYAQRTLATLLLNLGYSGELRIHIADDGSPPEHRDNLVAQARQSERKPEVTVTNAGGKGYGASWNIATQTVHLIAPIILPLEDDWELTHPLNIDGYVLALLSGQINSIRLGYLSSTQPLYGQLVLVEDKRYLLFDPSSPEPHVNAGHPRLETVEYERAIGPWIEGANPGTTEFAWCIEPAARIGVAWPMDAPPWSWFAHIGTVQARDDQGGRAIIARAITA